MVIIPAIDLKNGKCVRLIQGRMQEETVFSDEPEAMAQRWVAAGAELLHVVDLDATIQGEPQHEACIGRIVTGTGVRVQVGGGIRTHRAVEAYLACGAYRVIIGTAAIQNPDFVREVCRLYPGRIAAGIDARSGRVAIHGWTETTDILAVDLARRLEDAGVSTLIFTDIHRDGMQTGPNIEETQRLAEAVAIPVIASGGVGTLDHLRALLRIEEAGVTGVIVGKALYSGSIRYAEARALTVAAEPAEGGSKGQ
jgi:phosphoribosylformimino-5-aminoimidazole carboxamide ribotide isomerase